MAIYHASIKPVSRAEGRSATAASAYRSASRVCDYATGQTFDYTRKRGVEHAEIVLSTLAAKADINWARNRQDLWNAAEAAEKRKDARIGREYELALPSEMNREQRVALAREFASEIANRYNVAVDMAIHRPHRSGDQRNFHAHLISTTREVTTSGFGRKTDIELGDADRRKKGLGKGAEEITFLRTRWADITNEHLRTLGLEARIDHRSLKDQGIAREPTTHLGPAVTEMNRRGITTEVIERIREQQRMEIQDRLEHAAEVGRLEREAREVERSILDLSGNLMAAKIDRDTVQNLHRRQEPEPRRSPIDDIDARQQMAAQRWKARHLEPKKMKLGSERTMSLELGHESGPDLDKGPDHSLGGPEDEIEW